MSRIIKLLNGRPMPMVGMGTWQMTNPEKDLKALKNALNVGYRHFDTAYKYENEELVGLAINKWLKAGNRREDLFIVTKLPWIGMSEERVDHFIQLSLKKLQTNYIDLYLVHWPFGLNYKGDDDVAPTKANGDLDIDMKTDLESVWKAMERQVDHGRSRAIGLSNFNVQQIERIMKIARVKPANLQVEIHAYFQQVDLRETCARHGISVTAYGPLGSPGREKTGKPLERTIHALLDNPTVVNIAAKYGKMASQVLLRFLTQENIVVIPKSSNLKRMTENLNIFDFDMTSNEMEEIRKLDKGEEGRSFGGFPSASHHPEYPFPF